MNCSQVQEALLELAPDQFQSLQPHLEQCPDCAALAQRIELAMLDIASDIEQFVDETPFDSDFFSTIQPHNTRFRFMPILQTSVIAAAAAAALFFGLSGPPSNPHTDPANGPEEGPPQVTYTPPEACADLRPHEPRAMLGRLDESIVDCLFTRSHSAQDPMRDESSRILMVQLWASDQGETWSEQIAYHLDEIDDTDPSLLFKYGLRLSSEKGNAEEILRVSEKALNHGDRFSDKVRKHRIRNIVRLQARASQELLETGAWSKAQAREQAIEGIEVLSQHDIDNDIKALIKLCEELGC